MAEGPFCRRLVRRRKMNKTAPRRRQRPAAAGPLTARFFVFLAALSVEALSFVSAASHTDEAETALQCTAERDLLLVFDADDTAKTFKCPATWKLEPVQETLACQDDDCDVVLDDIVTGATLKELDNAYTLTLPEDSNRQQTTWYYLCKDPNSSANDNGSLSPEESPGGHQGVAGPAGPNEAPDGDSGAAGPSLGNGEGASAGIGATENHGSISASTPGINTPNAAGPRTRQGAQVDRGQTTDRGSLVPPAAGSAPSYGFGALGGAQTVADEKEEFGAPFGGRRIRVGLASSGDIQEPPPAQTEKECRVTVQVVPSGMITCHKGETKTATVSSPNIPVTIRCAKGLKLDPAVKSEVYDDSDGRCASQVPLTSLVRGNLSTTTMSEVAGSIFDEYVFSVSRLPEQATMLCYKCVEHASVVKARDEASQASRECRVKITVSAEPSAASFWATPLSSLAVAGFLVTMRLN
ncbi:hypothetical protein BESB_082050 [Besnoitia besnoiti]|uniref:SRS domain-containing protein n=1 Tax=Besnoitia besnoiti TaxID=94643 RepID=A0A2A9MAP5_BESBE|nr:hypothetical protein BESB_082050 [Besnoitia besnoiti]PFH33006.1 hypothetical protein BESB_082050 [Besnoitia besnoiti]